MPPAFYTRSPEVHTRHGTYFEEEYKDDLDYEEDKSCDIFSFGVIMHEILTETDVRSRFSKKRFDLYTIRDILTNEYVKFILEDENNDIFNEDLMQEYKNIIEKCMKKEVYERFSSFNEIIKSIMSSRFYLQNKEEIDFRILHAADSTDYKCKFSDIVECHFRRNIDCTCDLMKFIEYLNSINNIDFNVSLINESKHS